MAITYIVSYLGTPVFGLFATGSIVRDLLHSGHQSRRPLMYLTRKAVLFSESMIAGRNSLDFSSSLKRLISSLWRYVGDSHNDDIKRLSELEKSKEFRPAIMDSLNKTEVLAC
jgi:hypothetical protein